MRSSLRFLEKQKIENYKEEGKKQKNTKIDQSQNCNI